MLQGWGRQFTGLQDKAFCSGQPLWAILDEMNGELAQRSATEQWLDAQRLPNRLRGDRR